MSRIFAENWVMKTARAYWRPFAGLVTDFIRKYRDDLFLRTEVTIVVLQILYAALILVLTIGALTILYHNVVSGIVTAIAAALTSTSTLLTPSNITAEIELTRAQEIVGLSTIIFITTAIFGYLVARFALAPARSALAAQKQFIGNIAHELRTPLSIIKTNTEVRLFDAAIEPSVRAMHQSNLEELDRISDIINNLLSLNSLVQPERIAFDNVDIGKIVHRVIAKFSPVIQKKSLRIRVKMAHERTVWGNATALEQIVANVLKNALHFTREGEITIAAGPLSNGTIELTIRDTGVGIKHQDLLRIFEPFYRGDSARTRTGGNGSGLGLAIVSELVRLHNGRVNVQSAPDKGTAVTIILPAGKRDRPVERKAESDEVSADYSAAADETSAS